MLPSYTPIPEEVKELSIVRDVEDIPWTIADLVSSKVKYRADRKKLKRFDVVSSNLLKRKFIER